MATKSHIETAQVIFQDKLTARIDHRYEPTSLE